MNKEEVSNQLDKVRDRALLDKAWMVYSEIVQRKKEIQKNIIEFGRLFKDVRDMKLYKFYDHESFESFLGAPEISLKRATVYSLIHIYELYVQSLKVNTELLSEIGHAKLQVINPVVEKDTEDWLYKAKELSRSDLIDEVRLALGKPEKAYQPKKVEVNPFDYDEYVEFVKAHECLTCGDKGVDPAHFPKTRGAGAPPEWVIPLCRTCHTECDNGVIDFLINNKTKIFEYFYKVIVECYMKLKEIK